MSVLRAVRKRKKVRKLGAIDIIRREAYADLELDAKVELIRALVPLGLLHVQELLDQEVTALAGARTPGRTSRSRGAVTAATLGRWVWRGNVCRFVCPAFATSRGARSRCDPTRRCVAIGTWTTCC